MTALDHQIHLEVNSPFMLNNSETTLQQWPRKTTLRKREDINITYVLNQSLKTPKKQSTFITLKNVPISMADKY